MPPRVLVVCTANQCRSPVGAALLSEMSMRFSGDGWQVTSAGTNAMPGARAATRSSRLARLWGHDLSDHRARQLDRDAVAGADLVITMERDHLDAVLHLVPAALPRSFTWLELARLAPHAEAPQPPPGDAVTRLRRSLRAVHRARPLVAVGDDDVADPMGRPWRDYQRMATTLATSAEQFLPLLLFGTTLGDFGDPAATDDGR